MQFHIILSKVFSKIYTNSLNRLRPIITRSAATSNKDEAVDLAYSSYEYADKTSTKPPLVILHALLGSKNNWIDVSKAIHETTGRRVISIDARNHGDSAHSPQHTLCHMAHDLSKLLEQLELPKVSVFGHSMGGLSAMVFSLLYPDSVSSLIVEDVSPVRTNPQIKTIVNLFDAMATVTVKPDVPMSKARKLVDEHLKSVTLDINIRNYLITNLVYNDNGYTWRFNLPALKNIFKYASLPDSLKGVQYVGPTLFIGGSLSNFIGKNELPKIQEYFPLAQLTYIEGAGHWVHIQQPEIFHKVVCKFLVEN
ncbi:protein ABHD11-like isoform X1 [Nymphalis io]|uniref:protein ABHD11-like isoform X1 n=1 Tax=Inachis io TaxID=171585 RepID=UPI00216868EB|nr:protein ABHD11-like isoform X1 [Nymphalis io]